MSIARCRSLVSNKMQYVLALFVLGILCQNVLARGLDNAVLNDFERRLVRLESRQFSESENLEHRMLQLETQAGTQRGEDTLERSPLDRNFYEIQGEVQPSESVTFLQRLEQSWEKKLEEQLAQFSSKYDSLSERFSTIEKHVEQLRQPTYNEVMGRLRAYYENTQSAEAKSDEAKSDEAKSDEAKSDEAKSDEAKSDEGPSDQTQNAENELDKYHKVGAKIYYIDSTEKKTWPDSVLKCADMNMHLVSLQDEDEWWALKQVLKADHSYWTDINDIHTEETFVSKTTGTLAPFLNWDDKEPNSPPGAEDCVELRYDSGYKMNDVNCYDTKYYICEA